MVGRAHEDVSIGADTRVIVDDDEVRTDVCRTFEVEIQYSAASACADKGAKLATGPEVAKHMNPQCVCIEVAAHRFGAIETLDLRPAP